MTRTRRKQNLFGFGKKKRAAPIRGGWQAHKSIAELEAEYKAKREKEMQRISEMARDEAMADRFEAYGKGGKKGKSKHRYRYPDELNPSTLIPCKLKRMPNGTVKVYVAPGALAKVRNPFDLHTKLSHAVTEYDRKQSTKKFYNRYALPQYLGAVQDAMAEIDKGKSVRKALTDHFSGRLLDIVLKAAGEGRSTRQEQMY